MILALFAEENQRRLDRQRGMYAEDLPLWQRYERACDYLEDDLDSGYVRVLQEMIAAGWSNPVPPGNSIGSLTCPFRQRGWCGDGWLTRCCSRSSVC
jgi:hypothetical protein